jgi:phage shock protein C
MEVAVKRLVRSRRNRVFGGVCGGLAEYLGWDVVLVRVGYVGLTLFSVGTGIPLYLLAWILVPLEEPAADGPEPTSERPRAASARVTVGVFLAIIGILALISSFVPWFSWWHHLRLWGAALLIALGAAMLLWRPGKELPGDISQSSAPGGSPEPPPPISAHRLKRIRKGRKIAGVCAGIGEYLNVDPTIVRLIFIVLLFGVGVALPLYLILWIAMPLETS